MGNTHSQQVVVMKPLIGALSNRYGLSASCLILPPILTLYALTFDTGGWGYVLLIHCLLTATVLLLSRGLHRAKIEIHADGFVETDFFSAPLRIPSSELRSIVIVPVTDGNSSNTFDQLFLLDHAGATRMRLRGQFWGDDAVRTVATAFDLPIVRIEAPMVMAELRAAQLVRLYWHERHPYLRGTIAAAAVVMVIGPILWLVQQLI